jgi:hypothetical protein
MLKNAFIQHPASVGETYGEHLISASSFAARLFVAALACALHALLPFAFERTASQIVLRLHDKMVANRRRQDLRGIADARN